METEKTITVRHAPDSHCYELLDGQTAIGKTEYVPASSPADQERIFYHTEVSDAHAGKGLAAVLAKHALDDTIAAGLTIIPVPLHQELHTPASRLPAVLRTDPAGAPGRRRPHLRAVGQLHVGLTFAHANPPPAGALRDRQGSQIPRLGGQMHHPP